MLPYHRRGNKILSPVNRWPDFSVFLCPEGHLPIFSVIRTHLSRRFLLAVDFPGLRRSGSWSQIINQARDFPEQFPRHRYLGQLEGDIQAHLFVGCAADGMIHRILFNARRLVHENLDFHPERERVGAASGFGLVGADLALGLKSAQTFVCTLSQKSPENRFSGGLRLFWECMLIGGRTPLRRNKKSTVL